MLPPYIIEELRRREQARRREESTRPRPTVEVPLAPIPERKPRDEAERGVVIIDVL